MHGRRLGALRARPVPGNRGREARGPGNRPRIRNERDPRLSATTPYADLSRALSEKGIGAQGLKVINCVSIMSGARPADNERAAYVRSPRNLIGISLSMLESIKAFGDGEKERGKGCS